MEQEKERGITITSAAVTCFWNKNQINIIDTPVTSTSPSRWSVRCASSTAPSPCSTARKASSRSPSRCGGRPPSTTSPYLLRQQDGQARCGLRFTVQTIIDRLGAKAAGYPAPDRCRGRLPGVVDLIEMRALVWPGDAKGDVTMGASYEVQEIPADLADKAAEYREQLLGRSPRSDEALMEKYFSGEELTVEEIKGAIRKLTVAPSCTRCCVVPRSRTAVCSRCSTP